MDAEVAIGALSAALAVLGTVAAFLQLRRTPSSSVSTPPAAAVRGNRDSRGPLVVGDVPREPMSHLRRAELLAEVATVLATSRVCVLMGGRGVGKTHLAATYVRDQLRANVPRVVWVVADDVAAVVTSLADFARQAGAVDEVVDTEPAARTALRWLENEPERSVIVFDNALDADTIARWMPQRGNVHTLVTTTNQEFAVFGVTVHVEVFTPAQAVTFLCSRAGLDDPGAAALVARELGQLPLALAQAGAVIRRHRWSFAEYLAGFRSMPLRSLLPRVPGDDYPRTLEEATLLSVNEVEDSDPNGLVRRLIDLMAVLSEAGVRRDLLRDLHTEPASVDEALGGLANASVVGFDVTGTRVAMHRLTRQVVLARARAEGRIRDVVRDALTLLTRATEAQPASGVDLVDHIAEVWAETQTVLVSDGEDDEMCGELLRLRRWSVERLTSMGELSRAVATGITVFTEHRALAPSDDESIALARRALMDAYVTADRPSEAVPYAEQALADRIRLAGHDHPSTVSARNLLGYCCECGGQLDRALTIHRYNLVESIRVCGEDAPSTMGARINLASTYRSMGDLVKAVPLFEENLAENLRVYGPDHGSTINARGELARSYVRTGRADEGVRLHEENATLETDAQRADVHLSWWPQYRAAAYSAASRHDEAIDQLRALVRRMAGVLPHDNPQAIRLRLFLARALLAGRRHTEALALFERTVVDRERVLGIDHPSSLNARRNLGVALATTGRRRRARLILSAVVSDYTRVLGPEHPYTRTAQANIASLPKSRGFVWGRRRRVLHLFRVGGSTVDRGGPLA
ncbi:FxSxx-COOH system tetratricopeptide repeat protein [Micromonospora parva]|uniref:FxSxx-COOH system tetratricopeptide repeat protein n=1 Tax=Micromonospora parva TaxID=1464048 RepID=UPI0037B6D0D4